MLNLKPFQKIGVEFLLQDKHTLLADEMGLGKTVQAIAAINAGHMFTALIVCPASVKSNWKKHVEKYCWINWCQVVNTGSERIKDIPIIIINYDLLLREKIRKQLRERMYDVVILDEAHYLKNIHAKRTRYCLSRWGVAKQGRRVWCLTGTPILNRPIDLYPILITLNHKRMVPFVDHQSFAFQFCGAFWDGAVLNDRGLSNVDDLKERINGFMLRRTKEEVLPELPEKIYSYLTLPMTRKMRKVMDEKEKEIDEKDFGEYTHLATTVLLRKELALLKMDYITSHLQNILSQKNKVVVFCFHREVMFELQNRFGHRAVMFYGGNTGEREQLKAEFIDNPDVEIFIGQIVAAGQGLDGLQEVCDHVVMAELVWSPGEINQAIDRLHRIGQKSSVNVDFMLLEDTLEITMMNVLEGKYKQIEKLLKKENVNDNRVKAG